MSAKVNALLAIFIAVFLFSGHGTNASCLSQGRVSKGKFLSGWQNTWHGPLNTQCHNSALTGIHSIHNDGTEDRLFNFACSNIYNKGHNKHLGRCYWTAMSTSEQYVQAGCLQSYFVVGWASNHDNRKKDRQMSFRCCNIPGIIIKDCKSTGWLNPVDGVVNRIVPANHVITMVDSYRDKKAEDRRFSFQYCPVFFH